MADASWDNSGLPAQKQGLATWVKVLLGCGVVMLLLIVGCLGLAAWGIHRASTAGQAQWPAYVATVTSLEDPAATRALYDANPDLKKRYPDAEDFEKQVAQWRPAIQTPPAQMPPITSGRAMAFGGRGTQINGDGVHHRNGNMAAYRMEDGRMLIVVWQEGRIADIEFERRR